ncbi:TIGR01212 family radical SAM protein [Eubacterium coprostanoligenes]|uniref:TIGR01212 family radical SAM protein n=1 Tax=Eubacterium coprostanoligenes TaxID=290054 RepID=UPI0023556661|nr:TIGR01212 family radical SAM protein [Eubacterium coprostanoligenes]MCI6253188.1 TIGR01212 family radical SAM protein [Eubacterium coprostanoligenes]MDY5400421.1 TIGR01212 family radical SAM protein [Eubacterium coprostanoligenes]
MKYTTLNNYLKERFGEKVYKIALNGGFTCPNRDGSIDTRGCIFCSKGGSGDFAESPDLTITEQIENGKKRLEKKIKNGKYIAYFQAFTNTYAPVERLRTIYEEAINNPDIVALSIGTRPDCLGDDVLTLLDELNKIKPIFVELGLQTINEDTAKYIRRGYTLEVYDKAVADLHKIGINVVTHIILGLPNESKEDMLNSVKYACKVTDGIKLQLLHILKGTDLAKDYEQGKFEVLTLEQYTEIIKECVQIIPENVVIHRLTGDGAKKDLIAPLWSADKKTVLNTINRALKDE